MSATTDAPRSALGLPLLQARRTLLGAGLAHAVHDGYTDTIYVLLPIWQTEFALGFGALAALRGAYTGTMAALQIPAGRLAERDDADDDRGHLRHSSCLGVRARPNATSWP